MTQGVDQYSLIGNDIKLTVHNTGSAAMPLFLLSDSFRSLNKLAALQNPLWQ